MTEVTMELSKKLRDPSGEHKCDIIIALTHARFETHHTRGRLLYI